MPCDTRLKARQTLQQRAEEVRKAALSLDLRLRNGTVRPVISRAGAIAFAGWSEVERDGITDACAYRRIMATGTAMAKAAIARAELLSGFKVDKAVVTAGVHSHDGGQTWHGKG